MNKLRYFYQFLCYLIRAGNRHSIHSPFVYDFVTRVLMDKSSYPEYQLIDQVRAELQRSIEVTEVKDFGALAGSEIYSKRYRRIRDIARLSGIPAQYGQLLFRMIRYFGSEHILELGTSLGISTSYLASANPNSKILTLEGCPNTAAMAQTNFSRLGLKNIDLLTGEFGSLLDNSIAAMPGLDFVFIDGNHRKEPTLQYFNACLKKVQNETIMIFDDIYWSKEMEQAWKQIIADPRVTVSIDLFRLGVIFFRKELSKQDFIIRFNIFQYS